MKVTILAAILLAGATGGTAGELPLSQGVISTTPNSFILAAAKKKKILCTPLGSRCNATSECCNAPKVICTWVMILPGRFCQWPFS
jgi:hypothetical protein